MLAKNMDKKRKTRTEASKPSKGKGRPSSSKPSLSVQLPSATEQRMEPLKNRPAIPAPKRGRVTQEEENKLLISVPLIRPQAQADAKPRRVLVDAASIEKNARRWGVHQQSLKEIRTDIDARRPPLVQDLSDKGVQQALSGKIGKKKQKENAKMAASSASSPDGPILPTMYITEIMEKYPQTLDILIEVGLHCIGCQLSAYDTLETGCALHGMETKDVNELVRKMNARLEEEKKAKKSE